MSVEAGLELLLSYISREEYEGILRTLREMSSDDFKGQLITFNLENNRRIEAVLDKDKNEIAELFFSP